MLGFQRGVQKVFQSKGKPHTGFSRGTLGWEQQDSKLSCSSQGAAPEQEPIEHPSLWESKIRTWMERYEEASSNQYSEDVQVLLRVKEQGDGKSLAYNTHLASFKPPVEVGTQRRRRPARAHPPGPRHRSVPFMSEFSPFRVKSRRTRRSSRRCETWPQTP